MATIYRFIIENGSSGSDGSGKGGKKKETAKTITPLKMLAGGDGVNHNRSMRGINAVMNTMIPNYEKV